jgi:hypothetical protein
MNKHYMQLKVKKCMDIHHELNFWLSKVNGHAHVDFGCTHQLMGCFKIYPSTCWVKKFHMINF